uniref:Uncharacterized protein n=1 Tax=Fagus sylvatica TaxID=28930 RepID=A0A2N9HJ60_FAGSY
MPPKTRRAARTMELQAESQNNEQEQHQPEQSAPDTEARQTNLLLELIQGLQQTQGELAETVRQLKEKSSEAKNDLRDGEDHHENLHQEPSSHNNKEKPFITLSEVADLLQQEREKILKEPKHFVRKPPYPAELLKQPYPDKYVTPTFSCFDGRKGSALVHVSKFIDSMGPYAENGDLCLREFSKSLDDRTYTRYTTLPPGSVRTWDDMVEMFCGKYFQAEEKVTLVNLHGTKQGNGEDLLKYIHRFHDMSLDCYANYLESELVGICIDNMSPEFRAYLENLDITSKRMREFGEPPPPVPCTKEEMIAILNRLGQQPQKRSCIAAESGTYCFIAEAHASHAFLETTNAITFTDEDMDVPYPDHRRPLYLAVTINEVQVRRALVDTGSCINLVPLSTLRVVEISQKKIQGAPMEVRGFGGAAEYTKGHIQLVLKVGPIIALTRFHVIDSVVPYHVLLGRPWLHKHQLISSTYHQCVKSRLNGKPIRIAANPTPFDQSESHFVEASFYDKITPAREASLSKPVGTPLPRRNARRRPAPAKINHNAYGSSYPMDALFIDYEVDKEDGSELADAAGKSAVVDPKISTKEELEVIDLSSDPSVQRSVSISASLSALERAQLVVLLKEYQDVFAWQYNEMPGIDPTLVAHSLNVEPKAKPVVQPMRTFHPEVEAQISLEVKKLLSAGFIKPIQHPRWLSNIVPVKKKNGQIRCCVDFRDLNKACPKDEFPLPNMDLLIDSAAGYAMFSFMDGFGEYNQILMSPKDVEKTAFRTLIGNFYYTVMSFGLKNAGATYQRTMTTMFHDMMHRKIEDYVDDIVVKSKKREDHLAVLRKCTNMA